MLKIVDNVLLMVNGKEEINRIYYVNFENSKISEICTYLEFVLERENIPINYSIYISEENLISIYFNRYEFNLNIHFLLLKNFKSVEICMLILHEIGHIKTKFLYDFTKLLIFVAIIYLNIYLLIILPFILKCIEEIYADLYGIMNFQGNKCACIITYKKFLLLNKGILSSIRIIMLSVYLKLYKIFY